MQAPKLTMEEWKSLAPIGLYAAVAHGGSVLAMGAGHISSNTPLDTCFACIARTSFIFVRMLSGRSANRLSLSLSLSLFLPLSLTQLTHSSHSSLYDWEVWNLWYAVLVAG